MSYPARVPCMLSFFSSFATGICESSERQISKLSKSMSRHIAMKLDYSVTKSLH